MPMDEAANPLPLRTSRPFYQRPPIHPRNSCRKHDSGSPVPFGDTFEPGKIFGFPASGLTDGWSKGLSRPCSRAIGMFNAADDSGGFDPMNRPRRSSRQEPAAVNLEKKIQDALNESRILVLGVQVLLSFQYTSVLENAFVKLPFVSQALELITLALLLLTFGLLVSPAPYHLLVWRCEDSEDVQAFVSTIVKFALL